MSRCNGQALPQSGHCVVHAAICSREESVARLDFLLNLSQPQVERDSVIRMKIHSDERVHPCFRFNFTESEDDDRDKSPLVEDKSLGATAYVINHPADDTLVSFGNETGRRLG
mgnify:CR=1 FL=1